MALGTRLRSAPARPRRKPNLVIFLPDQQRADTVAPYGSGRVHAPNLNRLASESVVFDRTYVTHPICTPSRSSLMTGLWPYQTGCTHNNAMLAHRWQCLPEMLGDADYRTGYMGKWHLGDEVFAQHGFQEWVSMEDIYRFPVSPGRDPAVTSDYCRFLRGRGYTPDEKRGYFSREYASRLPLELSKPVFLEQHACRFLENHRDDPFVLVVSFLEPHEPYNGPLNNEHRLEDIELEASVTQTFGADIPLRYRLRQEFQEEMYGTTPADFRLTKRNYWGLVTEVDRSIGAILGKLDTLGLADDTIVVHTSDHGDMMGAHRLFEKEVLLEEAVRVPYLIRMPGQRRQARVKQPVSHIDFAPTMLDLLGKQAPPQCAGSSLAPLVRGETKPAESVFLEWMPNPGTANRTRPDSKLATPADQKRVKQESTRAAVSADGWKLCLRDHDKNELYNLNSDPGESVNLFYRDGHSDTVSRLTGEIHAWQQKTHDPITV